MIQIYIFGWFNLEFLISIYVHISQPSQTCTLRLEHTSWICCYLVQNASEVHVRQDLIVSPQIWYCTSAEELNVLCIKGPTKTGLNLKCLPLHWIGLCCPLEGFYALKIHNPSKIYLVLYPWYLPCPVIKYKQLLDEME